jgi:Rrf2 family protein
MKLSSQEEYGLRCLLAVAGASNGSITIPELSRVEGLSEANVAKMLRMLRTAGFVAATRGQSGGYTLARPAETIAVGEVLAALGGRLYEPAFCDTHGGGIDRLCTHLSGCSIRTVWQRLQEAVDGVLARLTVKDLLAPEGRSPWETSPSGATLPTLPQ